jgi:hypothetical protein
MEPGPPKLTPCSLLPVMLPAKVKVPASLSILTALLSVSAPPTYSPH